MKTVKLTLLIALFSGMIVLTTGCGAQKYAAQKRNLMLISKSEMPNNSRYREVTNRKTNKVKTKRAKRKSLF